LPGTEGDPGFSESSEQSSVMSSMMNAEGIKLAKAFRDADNTTKRKLIATLARCIVDMKD
jgi:soluble P-type ATPase